MDKTLWRAYAVELVGTFALVYFGAGVVCVNHMTLPTNYANSKSKATYSPSGGEAPLTMYGHQPGLVGVALAQGFILAALLAVTLPLSGGYLNPAVTLTLWVFNRLDNKRTWWFVGAQLLGAVLAGLCLRFTFEESLLREVRMGAPHLNPLLYSGDRPSLIAGTAIELVLTFFLVFAIFGGIVEASRARSAALGAGLTLVACVLFAFPLTGAATNPARWFGPVLWEATLPNPVANPWTDLFVYLAGPILGALLAGTFYFKVMLPLTKADAPDLNEPLTKTGGDAGKMPAAPAKPATTAVRGKK
jgi:glycerol uptake facilitator protein